MIGHVVRGMVVLCSLLLAAPSHAQGLASEGSDDVPVRTRYLLVGPHGGAVTDQDFGGRFQLITFGYTACPDVCPTTLVEVAEVLRLLGDDAAHVQGIFITVDPERDTVEGLKSYTAFFDSRIIGLGGPPEFVQKAAANYKVRYEKIPDRTGRSDFYAVDHSAGLYLLDRDGEFLKKFAYGTPASQIAAEIRSLVAGN